MWLPLCLQLCVVILITLIRLSEASSSCDSLSNSTSSLVDVQAFLSERFDVVIIGGGTAGVALAVRLAENKDINVGVLEAGVFHKGDPIIEIPHFVGQGSGNPIYDWNFVTPPQKSAGGRNLSLSRGKMLGGSSGLNGMAWTRATTIEYNAWRHFTQTSAWDWDVLLDFFKKSEDITLKPDNMYPGITPEEAEEAVDDLSSVAGFTGPITVSYNDFYPDVVPTVVETMNKLGFRTNPEPINGNSTGITNTRYSVDRRNGIRVYSPTGYLCPRQSANNLHILLGAQATQILFSTSQKELVATGVTFSMNNASYIINAAREVILSAGTVQTPQLLELSGIGNSSILEANGLKTLVDLPGVGENFQEHLYVGAQWQLKPGHTTFDLLLNATFETEQEALYNATRHGMLAALDSLTAYLPLNSIVSKEDIASLLDTFDRSAKNIEDSSLEALQYPIQRTWIEGDVPYVELLQWSRGIVNVVVNKSYVYILGGVMHPMSRGSSHINSADPLASPTVDPRFLSQDFDVLFLLNVLKFILQIGKTSPLSSIIDVQTSPDLSVNTDTELMNYIRNTSAGGDHLIGTAAMAPQENNGVVNSYLKVYGTSNLRVVDASVIPIHIATHIQATCYAIAEKAASMILSDLKLHAEA